MRTTSKQSHTNPRKSSISKLSKPAYDSHPTSDDEYNDDHFDEPGTESQDVTPIGRSSAVNVGQNPSIEHSAISGGDFSNNLAPSSQRGYPSVTTS